MRKFTGLFLILLLIFGGFAGAGLAQGTLSNQVLQLLTRINSWTATQTFYDLRVFPAAIPSTTTNRIYGDVAGNLYYNGGLIAGSGGGVTPHNWLSTTHPDTVASSPVRGAVVVADATPAWAKVQPSVSNSVLQYNGTDTVFGTNGSALTNLNAANLSGTAGAFDGNAITNLNATNLGTGTVPLARLSAITNTQIAAGAAIAYSKLTLTGAVVNADIGAAAAIAYSKLSLANSIVTGDIVDATIVFADWASNSCTSNQVARYSGTAWVCRTLVAADISGGGTVTSVAASVPGIFAIAGSPVTTTGTLAITLANQAANLVWAGPGTGVAAAPTFRALGNADLPLTGIGAGTYAKVTINTAGVATAGSTSLNLATDVAATILPMANGGTGVAVSADDSVLIGSGAAWVARTLPDCPTGSLAYTQATNLFNCSSTSPTHDLLSATHTDTLASAVSRGSMVVGNSTPKWAEVVVGTAGQIWTNDGTDPSWSNTLARGSIGTSQPWSWTQTWTVGGTTYRGLELVVTNTASAAGSTLMRLIAGAGGATTMFSVDSTGVASVAGNLVPTAAGTPTLGTTALPFGSVIVGTAATNNLSITPAAFAQGTVATADDPGLAAVKLALVRRGTIAYTAGALLTGTCSAAVTATVTGLATTSVIAVSHNAAPGAVWQQGIYFLAYPTADTVNVIVCNPTAGSLTPDNATFNFVAVVP